MARFNYVALSREGEEQNGVEDAASHDELAQRLRQRRLILIKADPVHRRRISHQVTTRLVGELAFLLDSGVVLERALGILEEEGGDALLGGVAAALREALKRGLSLSQALEQLGRFDSLLIPLVRAGEASGQLPQTLALLERHYDARRQLRAELTTAMAYPCILLVVAVVSLLGLGLYVIPVFKELFADGDVSLPLGTRVVFWVSDALLTWGQPVAMVLAATLVVAIVALRTVRPVRWAWHGLLLRLPLVGSLLALGEGARLMTLLGVLMHREVPLVEALELARDVVTNLRQRDGLAKAVSGLRQGRPLPVVMAEVPALPERAIQLLKVGNESGRLARACEKAGARLTEQLRVRVKGLVALMEPAIIVLMGSVIGFVVASMLLAVFSITELTGAA